MNYVHQLDCIAKFLDLLKRLWSRGPGPSRVPAELRCPIVWLSGDLDMCAKRRDQISRVTTSKSVSVLAPKVCVSGTSVASRPLAIRMRPRRRVLLRGSNVHHCPDR